MSYLGLTKWVPPTVGVDEDGDIYLLDWWRRQADSSEWVESVIDLMEKWRYVTLWAEEKGQIEKGVGPFLDQRVRAGGLHLLCPVRVGR